MKFNFKIQQYQTEAVDAVVNVFSGQGFHDKTSYIRDLGTLKRQNIQIAINLDDDEDDIYDNGGFKNEVIELSDEQLFSNIKKIQS